MTSPRRAEATAKGRYYRHPVTGTSLVSVTNVISVGVAKGALVPWAAKVTAEYAMNHLPALVKQARTDRDGATKHLKAQVTQARDKAADLGSRIHAHAEAHILGKPIADDPECAPYVAQYVRFLADFGVDIAADVEAAELTVANPAKGYAGTLDLILRLPLDGFTEGRTLPCQERRLWLVDIKTSATRPVGSVYADYALQLAALRGCTEAWLPDDTVTKMPAPIYGAAVLNLRTDAYALIPVPSDTPVLHAFLGALATTQWMHAQTVGDCRPATPDGTKPKSSRKKKDDTAGKAA